MNRPRCSRQRFLRLALEQLETRWAPAAGLLDPTFSADGRVAIDLNPTDLGLAPSPVMAVQADGRLVIAANRAISVPGVQVLRVNLDGTLDASFSPAATDVSYDGGSGMAWFSSTTTFLSDPQDVAVAPNGQIIVLADFGVARLNSDGRLDTTFGSGGAVDTQVNTTGLLPNTSSHFRSVDIQDDGKVVLGGTIVNGTTVDFIVARLNSDGTRDTAFGVNGVVQLNLAGTEAGNSVLVQDDGKIVIAGSTRVTSGNDMFAVARLDQTGALDTTFSVDGAYYADLAPGGREVVQTVVQQTDGSLVLVGMAGGTNSEFAAARLSALGELDATFATNGFGRYSLGTSGAIAYSAAFDSSRRLLLGGWTVLNGGDAFGVVRLTITGELDTTFDGDGVFTAKVGEPQSGVATDSIRDVGVRPDGTIVIAGRVHSLTAEENPIATPTITTAVAVLGLKPDGSAESTFSQDGIAIYNRPKFSSDVGQAIVVQSDGKVVVAGRATGVSGAITSASVARLNSDGTPDSSFGGDGDLVIPFATAQQDHEATSVILDRDGRLLVGAAVNVGGDGKFGVARLKLDGTLDVQFGDGGMAIVDPTLNEDRLLALGAQSTGKILLGGSVRPSSSSAAVDFAVVRLNADGTLDTSFGPRGDGVWTQHFGLASAGYRVHSILVDDQDRIVLVSGGGATTGGGAIVRLTADGRPDVTFNGNGSRSITQLSAGGTSNYTVHHLEAGALQSDGRILFVGAAQLTGSASGVDMLVGRLNPDGSFDSTFDADGYRVVPGGAGNVTDRGYGVAEQQNGRIVVAGISQRSGADSDFFAWRFNADGADDSTFAVAGRASYDLSHTALGYTDDNSSDQALAMALDATGNIVIAGYGAKTSGIGPTSDLEVARIIGDRLPYDIHLSSAEVLENLPAASLVGILTTDDPDVGDSHSYSLVGGHGDADNSDFRIVGNRLETARVFDHETTPQRSIRLRSTDSTGSYAERSLVIRIADQGEPPVAAFDSYETDEDQPLHVAVDDGVLANDTFFEGHSRRAILVQSPSHGTLELATDGSFVYVPSPNYHGSDEFSYRAVDGDQQSSIARVSLSVHEAYDLGERLVDAELAPQALFASGATIRTFVVAASPTAGFVDHRYFRFAIDGLDDATPFLVQLTAGGGVVRDAFLTLFDGDGNVLVAADQNAVPAAPGSEVLEATLQTGRVYVLGAFFAPSTVPTSFTLSVETGPQRSSTGIRLGASSGFATHTADQGADLLESPRDVAFFPLDLTNAGSSATVTLTPLSANVELFATLFRRESSTDPWTVIEQGSASGPLTLTPRTPVGRNLNDAEYQLVVAPSGFNTPARAFRIDVIASTLAPGQLSISQRGGAGELYTPAPIDIGVAKIEGRGELGSGAERILRFRGLSDGVASIAVHTTAPTNGEFAPVLALYANDGRLLEVASRTSAGLLELTAPVDVTDSGSAAPYYLRLSGVTGHSAVGGYSFEISQEYAPTPWLFGPNNDLVAYPSTIAVDPNRGGKVFRVYPRANTDVLTVELDAGSSGGFFDARVVIVGPSGVRAEHKATMQSRMNLNVDVQGMSGPFDVFVASLRGTAPLRLTVGQLQIPKRLDPEDLPVKRTDLQGDLQVDLTLPPVYGDFQAFQYFALPAFPQMQTEMNQSTSIELEQSGPQAMLALYREDNGSFKLVTFARPSSTERAELNVPLVGGTTYAVAAINGVFAATSPSVHLRLDGPNPLGIGVGMVPNSPPALPPDEPAVPNGGEYANQLRIAGVTLSSEVAEHFWKTILPDNLILSEQLAISLTPASPEGDLRLKADVYLQTGTDDPQAETNPTTLRLIGQATSQLGGSTLNVSIDPAYRSVSQLRGRTLYFRVSAVAGWLGDGTYDLRMTARTTNPHPYEVQERAWVFPDTPAHPVVDAIRLVEKSVGVLPDGFHFHDMVQNQHGDATESDAFVGGAAFEAHVYRFWSEGGPLVVRTSPPESGQRANTNFQVYSREALTLADGGQSYDYLKIVSQTLLGKDGNGQPFGNTQDLQWHWDWFPADRSVIDAQANLNLAQGWFYAVVRNQEASAGGYRFSVNAPRMAELGGIPGPSATTIERLAPENNYAQVTATTSQVAYFPAGGGDVHLRLDYLDSYREFVGYFPVQLPEHHVGDLTVDTQHGLSGSELWDLALFDASGARLPGEVADVLNEGQPLPLYRHTVGRFAAPSGPGVVWLRLRERDDHGNSARIRLNIDTAANDELTPPPATLPEGLAATPIWTSPLGDSITAGGRDATLHDQAAQGERKLYVFSAAAGMIDVSFVPRLLGAADSEMSFGVYVDGRLIAWDQPRSEVRGSTTTTVRLPGLRQPDDDVREFLDPYSDAVRVVRPAAAEDSSWDHAPRHEVAILVEGHGPFAGEFVLSVGSDAIQAPPARAISLSPLTGNANVGFGAPGGGDGPVAGTEWLKFDVPTGIEGDVQLQLRAAAGLVGRLLAVEVFDANGEFITRTERTFIRSTSPIDPAVAEWSLNSSIMNGGRSYFIHASVVDDARATMSLRATATIPKAGPAVAQPPAVPANVDMAHMTTVIADPSGAFRYAPPAPDFQATLWVDQTGIAKLSTNIGFSSENYLALYRVDYLSQDEVPSLDDFAFRLVDYCNLLGAVDGECKLETHVEPGLYLVEVAGNVGHELRGELPDYVVEDIVVNPYSGGAEQDYFANAIDVAGTYESYRTRHYRFLAPAGSQSFAKAQAYLRDICTGVICTPEGQATLTLWSQSSTGEYVKPAALPDDDAVITDPNSRGFSPLLRFVSAAEAPPLSEFIVGLHRQAFATSIGLAPKFSVPLSGDPDLVVERIDLLPDDGRTQVDVIVRNVGYAPSGDTTSVYRFSDTSKSPEQWTTSEQNEFSMGPIGMRIHTMRWKPQRPTDQVEYTVDATVPLPSEGRLLELNETNNFGTNILSSVDAHNPSVVSAKLTNEDLGIDPESETWGRFIHAWLGIGNYGGPSSAFQFEILDDDGDASGHAFGLWRRPYQDGNESEEKRASLELTESVGADGKRVTYTSWEMSFGAFLPTSDATPNRFVFRAIDPFGLESIDEMTRTLNVVEKPTWPTKITWNDATNQYTLSVHRDLIDYFNSTWELIGADEPDDVPFIGDLTNKFLVRIDSDIPVGLDASVAYAGYLNGLIDIRVLGYKVYQTAWSGAQEITEGIGVETEVLVQGQDLSASILATVRFDKIELFDWESPEIGLYSIGVKPFASINVNGSAYVNMQMDAAVSLALEADLLTGQVFPPPIPVAVAAPTFLRLFLNTGFTASAEVELVGFDLASVDLNIENNFIFTLGLDGPFGTIVPLEDFFTNFFDYVALQIDGNFGLDIDVEILGFQIVDIDFPNIPYNIANTSENGGVYTGEPLPDPTPQGGQGGATGGGSSPSSSGGADGTSGAGGGQGGQAGGEPPDSGGEPDRNCDPTPVGTRFSLPSEPRLKDGGATVGPVVVDPGPNLLVDSAGRGLYVQAVDVSANSGQTWGNLAFALKPANSDSWSAFTTVPGTSHVIQPLASWIGDTGTAVVVYNAMTRPADGNLSALTVNDFIGRQEIAYRFFDGATWSEEIRLTENLLVDSQPALSFNESGAGVLTWSQTRSAPTGAQFAVEATTDIWAARWDAATHRFVASVNLSDTAEAREVRPAPFAADDGRLIVAWLAGDAAIRYRQWDGTTWSSAATLPTSGVPSGGQPRSMVLGGNGTASDGTQSINLVVSYQFTDDVGTEQTWLFNRPSTAATFAQTQSLELVTKRGVNSTLKTTPTPDGGLGVYWVENHGRESQIVLTALGPAGRTATWTPLQTLSGGSVRVTSPTLSFTSSGDVNIAYRWKDPDVSQLCQRVHVPDRAKFEPPQSGVPTRGQVAAAIMPYKPELSFATALRFDHFQHAAPIGATALAHATIVNQGLAATFARVERVVDGTFDGVVATDLWLSPGASFDLSQEFVVRAGDHEYGFRVIAMDSASQPVIEAVTDADNTTSGRLSGQIELIVADIRLDVATPLAGDTVNILVTIENASDGPARPSNLALYLNDLNESPWPTAPKALVQVGEFTASERRVVSVPWTIPASGGNFAIWGWADALHEIGEVSDFNNISHTSVRIEPDAAVAGFSPSATETVELDVINYSARQNVRVRSGVVNHGQAPLHDVRVDLYWSHEGGAYELIGNQTVGRLAPGEHAPLQWNVDGWAGTNRYRVTIVTPTGQLDADQTDNVSESQLYLAGLADLRIAEAALADGPYVQSATLIVTATIENDGAALAEEFAVEVFAKTFDDGALRVGRAIVQRLVPHQSATLSLPLATSKLAGIVEFSVVVDRQQSILETFETNNRVSLPRVNFVTDHTAPTVAAIGSVSPDPRNSGVPFVDVQFSEPVLGFDLADVTLLRNGRPVSLAGVSIVQNNARAFRVSNLTSRTAEYGEYSLSVSAAGVTDDAGNAGAGAKSETWAVDRASPTSRMEKLPSLSTSSELTVRARGTDRALGTFASGIESYDIYVSVDGGARALWSRLPATNPTAVYVGRPGHSYAFTSVARDRAGNVEFKSLRAYDTVSRIRSDSVAPTSSVDSVNVNSRFFVASISGADRGGGVEDFELFVQVDHAAAVTAGTVGAGAADSSGAYHATILYPALADGVSHTYRFYSRARDRAGNFEAAPLQPLDIVVSATYQNELRIRSMELVDARGTSFIGGANIEFVASTGLAALATSKLVRLRFEPLDGAPSQNSLSLAGMITPDGAFLRFDFGNAGLGGARTSAAADGLYSLEFDLDGDGTYEATREIPRLFGDLTGDREISGLDVELLDSLFGAVGDSLADLNGDGRVDELDRAFLLGRIGRKLTARS